KRGASNSSASSAAACWTARSTQRRRRQRGNSGVGTPYWIESASVGGASGDAGVEPASADMVAGLFVGLHNARDERMPYHVAAGEACRGDAMDVLQHFDSVCQAAALPLGQVDLGWVAVDHRLAAEADTRQEHLHLFRRGVLGFVENHKGVVQRAPAHVCQRGDFDGLLLEELLHFVEAHEVV